MNSFGSPRDSISSERWELGVAARQQENVVYCDGDATLVIDKLGCQTRKVISSGHSAMRGSREKENGTQKWVAKQFLT